MKLFVVAAFLAVALVSADDSKAKSASYGGSSYAAPAPSYSAPSYSAPSYSAPSYSAPSYSAPSYSSSYSAPPCPKNYIFSCGPSVQPVPCAASSYGSSGAYSENMPQYAAPPQYYYPQQQYV